MRVVATLVVRDEVDIIAATLDHLLHQGVHHILVTDNGSRDGTRQILDWFEQSRPVTVFEKPIGPFEQGQWVTEMSRYAVDKLSPDWLIHVDADEFPLFGSGEVLVADALAEADAYADVITIQRHDYLVTVEPNGEVAPARLIIRKAESRNPNGESLAPKVAHRATPDCIISSGNHGVTGEGLDRWVTLPGLWMHHYPARSLVQATRKVTNLATGFLAAGAGVNGVGTVSIDRRQLVEDGTFESEYHEAFSVEPHRLAGLLADGSVVQDDRIARCLKDERFVSPTPTVSAASTLLDWARTVPPDVAEAHGLDRMNLDNASRRAVALFHLQARSTIAEIRSTLDGPIVLLKGIEVAQLYPSPEQRDFRDVDLLVDRLGEADDRLRNAGFEPFDGAETLPDYHQTAPLVKPDSAVTVELHQRPSSPAWSHFPSAEIIGEARPSRTGIDGILRPRDDHHAVLIAWHYWRDGAHRGRDLLDLHLLRQQVTDGDIESVARAWGVERVWRNTCYVLDAIADPGGANFRHRRLTRLDAVPHRTRRTRQWWGLAMGGLGGATQELRERSVRNRQRLVD